jgi:hypothetical protein
MVEQPEIVQNLQDSYANLQHRGTGADRKKTLLPAARYSLFSYPLDCVGTDLGSSTAQTKRTGLPPDSTQIGPVVGSGKQAALSGQRAAVTSSNRINGSEGIPSAETPRLGKRRTPNLTDLSKRGYAATQIDFTFTQKNKIVIRNSQLLLSLIVSLLLIGVGLIGFGKRTGLATT